MNSSFVLLLRQTNYIKHLSTLLSFYWGIILPSPKYMHSLRQTSACCEAWGVFVKLVQVQLMNPCISWPKAMVYLKCKILVLSHTHLSFRFRRHWFINWARMDRCRVHFVWFLKSQLWRCRTLYSQRWNNEKKKKLIWKKQVIYSTSGTAWGWVNNESCLPFKIWEFVLSKSNNQFIQKLNSWITLFC